MPWQCSGSSAVLSNIRGDSRNRGAKMKCSNNQCPSKLEPGTIECPAANNGCKDYKRYITNAEKMMASPMEMAKALCNADFCKVCCHFDDNGLCRFIEVHPDGKLYDGCLKAALEWLSKEAEE